MKTILYFLLLLSIASLCNSLPLSARSRWIVNEPTGTRVKLACVNWAGHLSPMCPEGLDKQPVGYIAQTISDMGFNCVRLTWATHMFTRYSNVKVAQSFESLGLGEALEGIARFNPGLLNLTVVEAQWAVVEALSEKGVMVVLDNHISKPMWCCSEDDGNGFFGDRDFDPQEWLVGLHVVAKIYKHTPMVVGVSLRNELRGALQNETIWYKHITRGATIVHNANPNVLVIISGLNYDLTLSFLKDNPLKLNFNNKIVYEVHRYSFSGGQKTTWLNEPFSEVCDNVTHQMMSEGGYLVEGPTAAPLFASEFGINQDKLDRADSLFLGCYLAHLLRMDLDWSVWALQGSYYLREGLIGGDESFGLLDYNWSSVRNPGFLRKLQLVQQQFHGMV